MKKKMITKRLWIVLALSATVLLAAGFVVGGKIASAVEQPKYQVLSSDDNVEIRQYGPVVVGQVVTRGERQSALRDGFRLLADYIFGNNTSRREIAMTAPVTQQKGEKIPMTAPVMQKEKDGEWTVQFVMPAKYSLDTLPQPNNDAVRLVQVPAKTYAVVRFSGLASANNIRRHEMELEAYLRRQNLTQAATPVYAFFNPPWTLPFMRRNEIMVELQPPVS